MRRRELIKRLRSDLREFRRATGGGLFGTTVLETQKQSERRLTLLHALESLLPEIIEKLVGSEMERGK